jgi:hypothetical protein
VHLSTEELTPVLKLYIRIKLFPSFEYKFINGKHSPYKRKHLNENIYIHLYAKIIIEKEVLLWQQPG